MICSITGLKEKNMSKKHKRQLNRPMVNPAIPASRYEFNPDYSTVKKDLKRIGTLAGFFIILLIALSFFLR
jgi:hypothetical protein